MNDQQEAFLLQLSRQIEIVLAACQQHGSAEVLVGSNRVGSKLVQLRLVAEKSTTKESKAMESTDATSSTTINN